MEAAIGHYLKIFVGMFVIVNPIGMAPFFLDMTEGLSPAAKRAVARLASITASGVLIGAALTGARLLAFFGVSLPAFRVAGGILILLIAIAMLQASPSRARQTPEEAAEATDKEKIAIVPLAIPLLAGPGAISTAILYANQAKGVRETIFLILTCVVVGICVYLVFRSSEKIGKTLGKTGINILTRLFGILLAAIGVEFITEGLVKLLPGLAR
jgi:multiple antibiotic resistance protein